MDITLKIQSEYFVKDLGEASALSTQNLKLLRLERDPAGFFWFVFSDKSACERLSSAYWSGELKVSAKAYFDSLRNLKDRLFARR